MRIFCCCCLLFLWINTYYTNLFEFLYLAVLCMFYSKEQNSLFLSFWNTYLFLILIFLIFYIYFFTLQYCIGFAIHQHEHVYIRGRCMLKYLSLGWSCYHMKSTVHMRIMVSTLFKIPSLPLAMDNTVWNLRWTGRPGVLRFMGSQRVGHDWATELNYVCFHFFLFSKPINNLKLTDDPP